MAEGMLLRKKVNMPELLFDIEIEDELFAGAITDHLQQEFADNGIMLSANASIVWLQAKSSTWQISDKGKFYIIRKQQAGLSVYMIPCCTCKNSVDISISNTTYYAMFGGTVILCPLCFLADV